MIKTSEIREKDTGAIQEDLAARLKHLFELRTQAVTEKLEDPTQLGKTKREIARIKTVLRERQLAEQKKSQETK